MTTKVLSQILDMQNQAHPVAIGGEMLYGIEYEMEAQSDEFDAESENNDEQNHEDDHAYLFANFVHRKMTGHSGAVPRWAAKMDYSLRGKSRCEVVLREPEYYSRAWQSVADLFDLLRSGNINLLPSPRTSFQIHANTLGHTYHELRVFLVLYMLFERLVYKKCWPCREESIFCWPVHTLTCQQYGISAILSSEEVDFGLCLQTVLANHSTKYAGLNINPLNKLGSIEWRMKEGVLGKKDALQWLSFVNTFHISSRKVAAEKPTLKRLLQWLEVIMEYSQSVKKRSEALTFMDRFGFSKEVCDIGTDKALSLMEEGMEDVMSLCLGNKLRNITLNLQPEGIS